ncbi:MAG: transporter [Candidatus Hydrogenedentes bacterium]|nr:transporter [Candidatus Hydrogenedentota bacterium]
MNFTPEGSSTIPAEHPGRRRWWIPAALFVSLLIGYVNRIDVSFALPAMAKEFAWTPEQVGQYGGVLLSLFFVCYGISNMILSPVAARMGPRRSLIVIVAGFSAATMLGVPLGSSMLAFGASRGLLGIAQGPLVPMMNTLTKHWFPLRERSRANGIWISGMLLAPLVAPLILVPVIGAYGWRTMFLTVGLSGLALAAPLLWAIVYDKPRQSHWMRASEVEHIEAQLEPEEGGPTWTFLRLPDFWLALVGGILNNFCVFGIMFWLPVYFTEGRGLPFADLWYAASLPYVVGVAGIAIMAGLGDATNRRALISAIGFAMTAVVVYLAAMTPSLPMAIACFTAGVFFETAYGAQEFALLQRILPRNNISRGAGIYNGIAVLLGGCGSSIAVGGSVSLTGSYTAGLLLIVGCSLAAASVLAVLAHRLKY